MSKKLLAVLVCVLYTLCFFSTAYAKDQQVVEPVSTYSDSYVVVNAYTGDVLFSKNANTIHAPASCTKILTALLVLEACEDPDSGITLDKTVNISENAVWSIDRSSSHIALQEGEVVTVLDLLYGLLLASANDCAVALAETVSGSVEDFCQLMNSRAKELGSTNSNFANPHGLDDVTQQSTAADLAKIMQCCLQNETFVAILSTNYYAVGPTNKSSEAHTFSNIYRMIPGGWYQHSDVICGKSGYTPQATNSLVTYAYLQEQQMGLIVVTMKCESEKNACADTANLLEYTEQNYHTEQLNLPGELDLSVKAGNFTAVVASSESNCILANNGKTTVQKYSSNNVILPNTVTAKSLTYKTQLQDGLKDIQVSNNVGEICFYTGDILVAKRTLVAASPILAATSGSIQQGVFDILSKSLWFVMKVLIGLIIVLSIVVLAIRRYNLNRRKRRRRRRRETGG